MARKLGKKKNHISEAAKRTNFNVFVATPAYDGKVDTGYCQSITDAAFACPLFGIKMTLSVLANGAFIDLARNQFVKAFLEEHKECTHLFFIDADLSFPPEAFVGLVRAGLPIVAGVYPKRQEKEEYPVLWEDHPDGGLWVEDEFIMARRVPTGFLLIERSVVEEMAADAEKLRLTGTEGTVPRLFYTDIYPHSEGGNTFIGEDFQFCDDYRKKYNRPIHVWPHIEFTHGKVKGECAEYLNRMVNGEPSDRSAA